MIVSNAIELKYVSSLYNSKYDCNNCNNQKNVNDTSDVVTNKSDRPCDN
jgi:hypothetical protein